MLIACELKGVKKEESLIHTNQGQPPRKMCLYTTKKFFLNLINFVLNLKVAFPLDLYTEAHDKASQIHHIFTLWVSKNNNIYAEIVP